MTTGKILDLVRAHADEYRATEAPRIVEVEAARYLALAGKGVPWGPAFDADVAALFTVGHRIRAARRRSGHDFKLGHLEALWWAPRRRGGPATWKALLRVPDFVGDREVREAAERAAARGRPAAAKVRLETLEEGPCIQALLVGPHEGIAPFADALLEAARTARRAVTGPEHDIYLTVPPTPPDHLRTLVRLPLAAPAAARTGPRGRDHQPATARELRTGATPQHRGRELR